MLLPIAELLIGSALLLGNRPAAPLAAIVLLLVFAAAMAINIMRGRRHIDCGCGHAGLRQELGWAKVARNFGMAAAVSLRLVGPADLAPFDLAVAIMAGAMLFLLMSMFNALHALPGRRPGDARG
jgi:phosphatidylglycerophosphate synthase